MSRKNERMGFRTTAELKREFERVLEEDLNGMDAAKFFEKAMIIAIQASRFYHSLPPSVFERARQYQAEFPTEPYYMCVIKALNHRLLRFVQDLLLVLGLDDRKAEFEAWMQSVGVDPEGSDDNEAQVE